MALEGVLRWAWLTSLPVVELLSREVVSEDFSLRDAAPRNLRRPRVNPCNLTPEAYLTALDAFLRERPLDVPTRKGLSRMLGSSGKAAAARSPRVLKAIASARHERRKAVAKARTWRTVCEIFKAVSWLAKGGRSVTSRNITDYLVSCKLSSFTKSF